MPMLARWGIDVVGFGPSIDDEDHYILVRTFPSREERQRLEDAFYGSDEWRKEHRPGVMELIETYHTVVLEMSEEAIEALRQSMA